MPKGRGSNERRRNGRQKMARRVNRIRRIGDLSGSPFGRQLEKIADAYEARRRARIRGKRNPDNFRSEEATGNTWKMSDAKKRSDKYWKAREKAREKA